MKDFVVSIAAAIVCLLPLQASWLDEVDTTHYPWVYHPVEGWQYVARQEGGSLWLYDTELGWCWTHPDVHQHTYNWLSGWITLMEDNGDHRSYFLHSLGDWGDDLPIDEATCFQPMPKSPWEPAFLQYIVNNGEPLLVSDSGMSMNLDVTDYRTTMTRTPQYLTQAESLQADVSGSGWIDGVGNVDFTGTAAALQTDRYLENAFGRYLTNSEFSMTISLLMLGYQFDFVTITTISFPQQLKWSLLSRDDLWSLPPGTVLEKARVPAHLEAIDRMYVDGDLQDETTYSDDAELAAYLEIVDHLSQFHLRGQVYEQVVVIKETQRVYYNDYNWEDDVSTHWVVPGMGIIKSQQYEASLGGELMLELIASGG